jgi:hypothetical protein
MKKPELANAVAAEEHTQRAEAAMQVAAEEHTQRAEAAMQVAAEEHTQRAEAAMQAAAEEHTQRAEAAMQAAAEEHTQRAEAAMQAAAEDSGQGTVLPSRAARQRSQSWLRRGAVGFVKAALTFVLAVGTAYCTSNYRTSAILDEVFFAGEPPVSTTADFDRDNSVQGLTWALRGSLGQLSVDEQLLLARAPSAVKEFNDWMRGRGGVDVDVSFIKLIVIGQREREVAITGMRAKLEDCEPPLQGTLFYLPPEGERENTQIGFDLDEGEPVAREIKPDKSFGERGYFGREYFKHHTETLALGQSVVFNIIAMTESNYCSWYIDMEVLAAGRRENVTVGLTRPGSQKPDPFRITARADSRDGKKGSFSVYDELYVLNKTPDPTDSTGFVSVDPTVYP